MRHRVELNPDSQREFDGLSPHTRRVVNDVLRRLRRGPDSRLDLPLDDQPGMWRAGAGRRWRVVFEVGPGRVIIVHRIRRRETAYDGIERPPRP